MKNWAQEGLNKAASVEHVRYVLAIYIIYIYIYIYIIYNTYSTSQSTIWENILRARKIFSRAKGEGKCGVRVKYHSHIVRRV